MNTEDKIIEIAARIAENGECGTRNADLLEEIIEIASAEYTRLMEEAGESPALVKQGLIKLIGGAQ